MIVNGAPLHHSRARFGSKSRHESQGAGIGPVCFPVQKSESDSNHTRRHAAAQSQMHRRDQQTCQLERELENTSSDVTPYDASLS